jgi:hypothetical protein
MNFRMVAVGARVRGLGLPDYPPVCACRLLPPGSGRTSDRVVPFPDRASPRHRRKRSPSTRGGKPG